MWAPVVGRRLAAPWDEGALARETLVAMGPAGHAELISRLVSGVHRGSLEAERGLLLAGAAAASQAETIAALLSHGDSRWLREGISTDNQHYSLACAVALLSFAPGDEEATMQLVGALGHGPRAPEALRYLTSCRVRSARVQAAVERLWRDPDFETKARAAEVAHAMGGDDRTFVKRLLTLWACDGGSPDTGRLVWNLWNVKPEHWPVPFLRSLRYDLSGSPEHRNFIRLLMARAGHPID